MLGKKKKIRIIFRTFSGPFTVNGKHQNWHDCTVDFTGYILSSIYFYQVQKSSNCMEYNLRQISVQIFQQALFSQLQFLTRALTVWELHMVLVCLWVFLVWCLCFIISIAAQPIQFQASLPCQKLQRSSGQNDTMDSHVLHCPQCSMPGRGGRAHLCR